MPDASNPPVAERSLMPRRRCPIDMEICFVMNWSGIEHPDEATKRVMNPFHFGRNTKGGYHGNGRCTSEH